MISQFPASQIPRWFANRPPQMGYLEHGTGSVSKHLWGSMISSLQEFLQTVHAPLRLPDFSERLSLNLLSLKNENVCPSSPPCTTCDEGPSRLRQPLPSVGRFRDLRFVRTAELLAGKWPLQPQEYQEVIQKHCTEARQTLLSRSACGLSVGLSWDSAVKAGSQPGGATAC